MDLSKAKAGQIAHFRCGGSAKIEDNEKGADGCRVITFSGCTWSNYTQDGEYKGGTNHPFNIIRLEEPTFDWKDVKPGMAFKYAYPGHDIETVYYTWDTSNGQCFSMQRWDIPQSINLRYLSRSPNEDVIVKVKS